MPRIEVYSPVATPRVQTHPLAARATSLDGLRIGWCDNLKANAGSLLESVREGLGRTGTTFESFAGSKNATAAAPEDLLAHLKACDAVVLAIAD